MRSGWSRRINSFIRIRQVRYLAPSVTRILSLFRNFDAFVDCSTSVFESMYIIVYGSFFMHECNIRVLVHAAMMGAD